MSSKEDQIKALETQGELEEAISTLYQAYAKKFPEHEPFWTRLATDEVKHANWVRAFRDKLVKGSVFVQENRFQVTQLNASLNHVKEHLRRTEDKALTKKSALSIALYIEQSMLESHLFDFLESDVADLKKLLLGLNDDTKKHHNALQELWAGC